MENQKHLLISEAIKNGDWSTVGDMITRNDLMNYLLIESQNSKQVPCPMCLKNIKPNKVTFTHRSYKYLLSAVFLSQRSIRENDGENGYVHHSIIREHCLDNWLYERGKRKGIGIDYTSYSNLTKMPWDFLEARHTTGDKLKRDGYFKPTDKCLKFLRGHIDIPESITILNREVVRYSKNNVNALTIKDVNFHQCIELFKTFS